MDLILSAKLFPIHLLLLDPEPTWLDELSVFLERYAKIHVGACCTSSQEIFEHLQSNRADLLVLDFCLEPLNGVELAQLLYQRYAIPSLLLLSSLTPALNSSPSDILRPGVQACLDKNKLDEALIPALLAVIAGESWFPQELKTIASSAYQDEERWLQTVWQSLTVRERDLCLFLLWGYAPTEIAEKLRLGSGTVKWNIKNIRSKFQARHMHALLHRLHQIQRLGIGV